MTEQKTSNGQDNSYFDRMAEEYADQSYSIQPEFYKNAARKIDSVLKPGNRVLDIGNGGLINYRYDHLGALDCADLALSHRAEARYREEKHIRFFEADILNLHGIADETYDAVLVQAVLHHLAGKTYRETEANVQQALVECMRVVKKGGSLLIVESTVFGWFQAVERALYPLMQLFFRLCKFEQVYQFSAKSLEKLCCSIFSQDNMMECSRIGLDRYIWLMGHKVPSALTPCSAVWIRLQKGE